MTRTSGGPVPDAIGRVSTASGKLWGQEDGPAVRTEGGGPGAAVEMGVRLGRERAHGASPMGLPRPARMPPTALSTRWVWPVDR